MKRLTLVDHIKKQIDTSSFNVLIYKAQDDIEHLQNFKVRRVHNKYMLVSIGNKYYDECYALYIPGVDFGNSQVNLELSEECICLGDTHIK